MTLKKDTGIDTVELRNTSKVDVGDDSIENEVEVFFSCHSSIKEVGSSNTVEVVNIPSDSV